MYCLPEVVGVLKILARAAFLFYAFLEKKSVKSARVYFFSFLK
jgi:hypothetical protein